MFMSNSDEHRTVTAYLDEKREEFYVIQPLNSRPQRTPDLHRIRRNTRSNRSRFPCRKGGTAHQSSNKIPAPHIYGGAQKITRFPRYFYTKKALLSSCADRYL
ncbi:hypothetical protein TNIN_200541 [Trichonephila inaurata madagascariensis]|uniref:Uncharacterized protein n=1 Tax=Trichonephila inaurata madagascariensis TaxID=2747483 RepID=A0A8X7C101_9ARAC|nr:hypothetical protein TNIN_200541 [Trichonephila inaurata madagascariensis]